MQHYNEELIALLLEHGAQATSAFDKVCLPPPDSHY